jgi:hypothetical protein
VTLVAGAPPILGAVLALANGEQNSETEVSAQKTPCRRRTAAAILKQDIVTHPVQKKRVCEFARAAQARSDDPEYESGC